MTVLRGNVTNGWILATLSVGVAALVAADSAVGDEEANQVKPTKSASDSQLVSPDHDADLSNWFLFLAASNLHPRLDETEALIDKLINKGLGAVHPRWDDPETFSDWRDEFRLWEIMAGVGYHLSPKWAWYVAAGIIQGTTEQQTNMFPLFLPLKSEVDFTRYVRFVTTGIDYYPWGKGHLPPKREGEGRLLRRLRGARPYAELATGYVHVNTEAPVALRTLGGKRLIRYNKTAVYDMTYISPRLGLDIPLTRKDTFAIQAGYLFFDKHKAEYNNASFYLIYKHRFGRK